MVIDNQAFLQGRISIYALLIFVSLLTGFLLVCIKLRKEKVGREIIVCTALLSFLCCLFFSLLCNIVINIEKGLIIGLNSTGAAVGMIAGGICADYIFGRKKILRNVVSILPLSYAISKIGCFLVGCCYGIPYDGFLFVQYTTIDHTVFPVQLLESVVFFFMFIVFCFVKSENKAEIMIITGAILKILLDFLRDSHRGRIITGNQIICLMGVIIFGIKLAWEYYRTSHDYHGNR